MVSSNNQLAQNPVIEKEIAYVDLDGLTCVWITRSLFHLEYGSGEYEQFEFDVSQIGHLKKCSDQ